MWAAITWTVSMSVQSCWTIIAYWSAFMYNLFTWWNELSLWTNNEHLQMYMFYWRLPFVLHRVGTAFNRAKSDRHEARRRWGPKGNSRSVGVAYPHIHTNAPSDQAAKANTNTWIHGRIICKFSSVLDSWKRSRSDLSVMTIVFKFYSNFDEN